MAEQAGTVERLALALGRTVQRLASSVDDASALGTFAALGAELPEQFLTAPGITPARATLLGAGNDLGTALTALSTALDGGGAVEIVAAAAAVLTRAVPAVTTAVTALGTSITANAASLPGTDAAQLAALVDNLPRRLFDLAVWRELRDSQPWVALGLALAGILEQVEHPGDEANPTKPSFVATTLRLDRLPTLVTRPDQLLGNLYGWGGGLNGAALLTALRLALTGFGVPVFVDTSAGGPRLVTPMFELAAQPPDLAVTVPVPLSAVVDRTDQLAAGWSLRTQVGWGAAGGTVVRVHPPLAVSVEPGPGTAEIKVTLTGAPAEPFVLLGQTGGSRLELAGLSAAATFALTGPQAGQPVISGELTGGRLVVDTSAGDGFLSTVLGGARLEAGFEAGLTVDAEHGVQFRGSGGIEAQLPVHIELGPVEVQSITLAAGIHGHAVMIELSAGFSASLGPVRASVERVGVRAELSFPAGGGNVGPAQLDFAFKPPSGVGLAVDAGIVAGGGFLYFDEARGEYAGALELEFAGFIEVKAIGLITTRMPDGSRGFSLLIVLTAEFGGGGIQLGFGFKLLGVGGILGLNRRMDLDALVEGVVSGSIQSVLFPRDVVANAPRIISDLRRFFPPEDGTFLIGPMAKIGWGTPTLVTVSLGLIVEIPPGNIAILGVLECVLPSADVPLLVLRVNFVGALEVDKSRLWFFARLFDSHVLTMTIDGGMGLLVGWGDNPDFVLSVGGFHPAFTPPPLPFPVPPRISVDILNAPGRLIRVSGYFAVTSNTVQFGAKAELRLGFSDFGLEGHLSFDALFRFSPFSFVVAISAGVSLKAFGIGLFSIDLNFTLEGPAPWRAHGRGSISLLFFEISADFDITWGEERTTTLPPVVVLELLAAEVRKTEGWQTRLPAGGTNPLVTLRQLPPGDDLVLHPLGALFVHQRAIPLGVRLDRVGAQRPSDGKRFTVTPKPGSGLVRRSVTGDKFAMAQFQDMDDAAKLSRPAYEDQDAGLELVAAGGAIVSPRVVRRSARYELHIIDNEAPSTVAAGAAPAGRAAAAPGSAVPGSAGRARVVRSAAVPAGTRRAPRLYTPPPAVFGQLLQGSSTARSPLSQQQARQRQPYPAEETVQVPGSRYVVAYLRNNQQAFPPATASATTSSFRSVATAADAMADWIRADPALAGQLHILRQAEVPGGVLAEPGVWSPAADPPAAVAGADAVRLSSGRVLVAGGADATGTAVATAALFDPVAGTWAAQTGPLAAARRRHTTTRLGDGRVVAAGGLGADGAALASVEVFDPVAGTWSTPQAGLATARSGHSAAIANRRLLVAGGTSARGAALASAELLDPATLTWAAAAPMAEARTGHAAVVLGTGAVLVVGGAVPTGAGDRALASCELYDPRTGTWTPTGSLSTPRKGHQATLLPGGRVLVTGGDAVPAIPYRIGSLAAAEVYDPHTGVWTPVGDLPGGGRSGHRCVRTPRGAVVIGGVGRPRATAGYRDVVSFDPATGSWTATGALATGRWDFPAVDLADGRVLVVGGRALAGPAAPGPAELATTAETYLP